MTMTLAWQATQRRLGLQSSHRRAGSHRLTPSAMALTKWPPPDRAEQVAEALSAERDDRNAQFGSAPASSRDGQVGGAHAPSCHDHGLVGESAIARTQSASAACQGRRVRPMAAPAQLWRTPFRGGRAGRVNSVDGMGSRRARGQPTGASRSPSRAEQAPHWSGDKRQAVSIRRRQRRPGSAARLAGRTGRRRRAGPLLGGRRSIVRTKAVGRVIQPGGADDVKRPPPVHGDLSGQLEAP
jgi:hypothetical protein